MPVEITPSTTYRFTAVEVMKLLRQHTSMDERAAADIVTNAALVHEIAEHRATIADYRESITDCETLIADELRKLNACLEQLT